uniref:Uncharacterized protein n=1 Tax=Arundo donax TaxID=35708 RepID=A0A0A9H9J0_ARUDO
MARTIVFLYNACTKVYSYKIDLSIINNHESIILADNCIGQMPFNPLMRIMQMNLSSLLDTIMNIKAFPMLQCQHYF